MLEQPNLKEALIALRLRQSYGLDIHQINFLPLGCDLHSAVYRVDSTEGLVYFLKLRKGGFTPLSGLLPQFLHRQGIKAIIAPLETSDKKLFCQIENYTAILYPFISGKNGYQVQLTDRQWVQLGQALRSIHSVRLPLSLASQIPGESFDPQWRESARYFLAQLESTAYDDPAARQFSAFLHSKQELISHMRRRAEILAAGLKKNALECVLCHSDAHPGNYLVADTGSLYLVDWDSPVFALKECDLMCFGSGMGGMQPGGREERLFYQGYGCIKIDPQALAYYRYERIIQDIAEFSRQVLGSASKAEDRAQAYRYLTSSFMPSAEVDVALRTDQQVGVSV
jgi:spectinomycin phosphotransferase